MKKSKVAGFIVGLMCAVSVSAQIVREHLPDLTMGTTGVDTVLSSDLWGQNPDADSVIRQIEACADVDFNPAELNILRQVLLTDVGGQKSLEEKNDAYLKARLTTLLRQGLFDEVILLIDRIQPKLRTNEIKQLRAEALFASGRIKEVCEDDVLSAFEQEEAFMRVICADALRIPPEPALAFEIYRERGENLHPFAEAAGDVLYRNLPVQMPDGEPSVWEVPLLAKAFGDDIFRLKLNREKLWTLIAHEQVPHEVRIHADNIVNAVQPMSPNGQVLNNLIQVAKARKMLEQNLPSSLHQRQVGIKRAE